MNSTATDKPAKRKGGVPKGTRKAGRKKTNPGDEPGKNAIPIGFALRLGLGESLNSLATSYGVKWTTARRWSETRRVQDEIEGLKRDLRMETLQKLFAIVGPALARLVELSMQNKDLDVALKATIRILDMAGLSPVARSSIEITPGNAATPKTDAELLAELAGLRAQVLPHPQPAEEPLPAALTLSPDVERVQ